MIVIYHDAFLANYIRYTCIVYIGIVIFVMFNFFSISRTTHALLDTQLSQGHTEQQIKRTTMRRWSD